MLREFEENSRLTFALSSVALATLTVLSVIFAARGNISMVGGSFLLSLGGALNLGYRDYKLRFLPDTWSRKVIIIFCQVMVTGAFFAVVIYSSFNFTTGLLIGLFVFTLLALMAVLVSRMRVGGGDRFVEKADRERRKNTPLMYSFLVLPLLGAYFAMI